MRQFMLFVLAGLGVTFALWTELMNSVGGGNGETEGELYPAEYGVDHSSPIHHYQRAKTIFRARYEASMAGCYASASRSLCDGNERARLEMNRQQPATQHNYTELGFKKLRVPDAVWKPLIEFYNSNKDQEKIENWPAGNTYVNHWESPSMMVSLEDRSLRGGLDLKQTIWNGLRPVLEEWTGKKLKPTSLYGIRVYKRGAILATHVDRLPLVSSCIIQVAQDLEEPWPVEVYSHAGRAYNVTMVPGDMTLYESHTVLHGRPFPLNGTFYANVFVHYIPVDHEDVNAHDEKLHPELVQQQQRQQNGGLMEKIMGKGSSANKGRNVGGHEQDNHDEEVLRRHIDEIEREQQEEEQEEDTEEVEEEDEEAEDANRTAMHVAASMAELDTVTALLEEESGAETLNTQDRNGWTPLHEAVRAGNLDVIKLMINKGADTSIRTTRGGTALWWARRLDLGSHIISYLESIHAPEEGEDL